jgi:GT2 family glycosyltransferase
MFVGANFAFDRAALESVGGFVTGLDRVGKKLLSGGDTLIQRQMDSLGYPRYYNPSVRVDHHVPASRANQRWMLRRGYWQGVSEAIMEITANSLSRGERLHRGLYRARQFLFSTRVRHLWLRADNPAGFRLKYDAVLRCGAFLGMLGLANGKAS